MPQKKKREVVIAGNWKMHKKIEEACLFVETLAPLLKKSQASVYLAAPFTSLYSLVEYKNKLNLSLKIGAQNMHDEEKGAYTGEISAGMLKDTGAEFVILGHSERRYLFGETSSFINRKIKRALDEAIQPILCVGETELQRLENKMKKILENQILESLEGISDLKNLILAYEPVWAIGTGKVSTSEDAEKAHAFCRQVISQKWGHDIAKNLIIQYGGSVKPENAADLLNRDEIDGLLVGGASLSPEIFSQIVNVYQGMS